MFWIKNRCDHAFLVASVSHTNPSELYEIDLRGSGSIAAAMRMREGCTHVCLRCRKCGALDYYSIPGIHKIEVEYNAQKEDHPIEA